MVWFLYTVTSFDRFADGSFDRMRQSMPQGAKLFVAFRGFTPENLGDYSGAITLPFLTSLSKARNALLEEYPPDKEGIVAFPDDDCWYPKELAESVEINMEGHDFLLGVVDMSGTENSFMKGSAEVDLDVALQSSASAALWVNASSFGDYKFDEALGLGAKYKSGEDLDLIVLLLSEGSKGMFLNGLRVGHPARDRSMEYFPGSIAVLAKNRASKLAVCWPLARRLAHGVLLTIAGRLKVATLLLSLKAARHQRSKFEVN